VTSHAIFYSYTVVTVCTHAWDFSEGRSYWGINEHTKKSEKSTLITLSPTDHNIHFTMYFETKVSSVFLGHYLSSYDFAPWYYCII
jgi:hypothetical protein